MRRKKATYEAAGVSLERGEEVVRRIQGMIPGIGDFGGRFPLDVAGMKKPILVAGADGVGTKVKVAIESGIHDTVGIDLVAMSVNDVLCSGALPLFFLDYVATARIDPDVIEGVVKGIVEGCRLAGCVLLGGETAEMPGMYATGDYDLAGFAVGLVDEPAILGPEKVKEGDVLIGLDSSGLHSNGYSLARRVLKHAMDEPFGSATVKDALRVPTRIYCKSVLAAIAGAGVHACAHITGSGIPGNAERILPKGLGLVVDRASWTIPPLFALIEERGSVSREEMYSTFNMGLGMILAVAKGEESKTLAILSKHGETARVVGRVVRGAGFAWA